MLFRDAVSREITTSVESSNMIPSRGILLSSRTISIGRRRAWPVSTRSFSESTVLKRPPQIQPNALRTPRLIFNSSTTWRALREDSLLRNASTIRFASSSNPIPSTSTSPIPPAPQAAPDLPGSSSEYTGTSFDDALDISGSLLDIEERIGFLKQLGLDFGWGPTSSCEYILEHVHVWSGLPWYGTIIATAILVRVGFFQIFRNASDNAARMQSIQHLSKPLMAKQTAAAAIGDSEKSMALRREMQILYSRAGVSMYKSFLPFVSAIFSYGLFNILRHMAKLPVPGFEDGGALWFHNLAAPDPYLILPLASAAIIGFTIKAGGEAGVTIMKPSTMNTLAVVVPVITVLFTYWFSAAVQLQFLMTGALMALQGRIFRSDSFRAWLGMYPLPKKPTSTPESTPPNPRVITLRPSATTGTWEAPRAPGEESPSKAGMFGNIIKSASATVDSAKSNLSQTIKSAKEKMGDTEEKRQAQKTQEAKKKSDTYEAERRKEERNRERQRRRVGKARRQRDEE